MARRPRHAERARWPLHDRADDHARSGLRLIPSSFPSRLRKRKSGTARRYSRSGELPGTSSEAQGADSPKDPQFHLRHSYEGEAVVPRAFPKPVSAEHFGRRNGPGGLRVRQRRCATRPAIERTPSFRSSRSSVRPIHGARRGSGWVWSSAKGDGFGVRLVGATDRTHRPGAVWHYRASRDRDVVVGPPESRMV